MSYHIDIVADNLVVFHHFREVPDFVGKQKQNININQSLSVNIRMHFAFEIACQLKVYSVSPHTSAQDLFLKSLEQIVPDDCTK